MTIQELINRLELCDDKWRSVIVEVPYTDKNTCGIDDVLDDGDHDVILSTNGN